MDFLTRSRRIALIALVLVAPAAAAGCEKVATAPATTTTTAPATTAPATTAPATTAAPTTTTVATTTTVKPTTTTTTKPTTTTTKPATTTTTVPATTTTLKPNTSTPSIRVSGKNFIDQTGAVVQLRGVNRPGTEYRCVQNIPYGFITDDGDLQGQSVAYAKKVIAAMVTWDEAGDTTHAINTVRIPLNEDCWLAINGATAAYAGTAYQNFIKALVNEATNAGMVTILDLHWSAPGTFLPTQQDVGPNADHSITFWSQVASTFAGNPAVMFDLFNEPHLWCYTSACASNYNTGVQVAWGCYRDGCRYDYSSGDYISGRTSGSFQVAGTQQLVNAIRATGAANVILIAGLGYANALDNWVNFKPTDPLNQIAAAVHTYTNSGTNANNTTYLDGMLASGGLSSKYPILVGEFGEWLCNSSTTGFTEATMAWADSHGYSYTAWGWDSGEGCGGPTLVSGNTSGTPTAFGTIVRTHLRQRAH